MQIKPPNRKKPNEISNQILIAACILVGCLSSLAIGFTYRYDASFDPLGLKKSALKADIRQREIAAKRREMAARAAQKKLDAETDIVFSKMQAKWVKECLNERSAQNQGGARQTTKQSASGNYIDKIFASVPDKFSACNMPIVKEVLGPPP
jgi:hypothetical protein